MANADMKLAFELGIVKEGPITRLRLQVLQRGVHWGVDDLEQVYFTAAGRAEVRRRLLGETVAVEKKEGEAAAPVVLARPYYPAVWNSTWDASARFLSLALSEHADQHGACRLSNRKLARATGFGLSTVIRCLTKLEQVGFLSRSWIPGSMPRMRIITITMDVEKRGGADGSR